MTHRPKCLWSFRTCRSCSTWFAFSALFILTNKNTIDFHHWLHDSENCIAASSRINWFLIDRRQGEIHFDVISFPLLFLFGSDSKTHSHSYINTFVFIQSFANPFSNCMRSTFQVIKKLAFYTYMKRYFHAITGP